MGTGAFEDFEWAGRGRPGVARRPPTGPTEPAARIPVCDVVALDDHAARAVGQLCGVAGTTDVVDAFVALTGRQRALRIITSDPDGLRPIDRRLDIVPI